MKKILIFILLFPIFPFSVSPAYSKDSNQAKKVKFYNFDDLLIDGKIKKPQVLWTDARQKVRFEKLLKLKKDFLPLLKNTKKDPSLR